MTVDCAYCRNKHNIQMGSLAELDLFRVSTSIDGYEKMVYCTPKCYLLHRHISRVPEKLQEAIDGWRLRMNGTHRIRSEEVYGSKDWASDNEDDGVSLHREE